MGMVVMVMMMMSRWLTRSWLGKKTGDLDIPGTRVVKLGGEA